MPIQPQQFPILDSGMMSPFHQALQSGLQTYMSGVQAAYLPSTMKADVASKQAYANYLPYQNIASALSNPLTLAMMSPEQRSLMLNNLANMPMQFGQGSQSQNGGGMLDSLKHMFGMGGNQQQMPSPQNSGYNMSGDDIDGYLKDHPDLNAQFQRDGQVVIPPNNGNSQSQLTNQVSMGGGPIPNKNSINTPEMTANIPITNALGISTGNPSGDLALAQKYPSAERKIAIDTASTASKTAAGVKTKLALNSLQKLNDEGDASTKQSMQLDRNLDNFKRVYDDSYLTGPLLGKLAPYGPVSGQLKQISTNMQTEVASQLFGSRVTNYKEQLAKYLKLDAEMPRNVVNSVYERMKAEVGRSGEYQSFIQEMQDKGVTDPNRIKKAWNDYNIDMPFFDTKNGKVITENNNQYEKYIDSYLSGKPLKNKSFAKNQQAPEKASGEVRVEHDGKYYALRNGQWIPE